MVSPRSPYPQRYGPSKSAGTRTDLVRRRFDPGLISAGITNAVGEYGGYLRKNEIEKNGFVSEREEEEEEEEIITEEMLLQRALAALRRAESRGDGAVEMEEREWQAWQRHEAMEREIEKRVVERERERELQREREIQRELELQRQLDKRKVSPARSERTNRSTSISRNRSGSGARTRSSSGTFGMGEPGFIDDGFAPYSSSANSSPQLSHTRPYVPLSGRQREPRMPMNDFPDHQAHPLPRYAREVTPSYSALPSSTSHSRITVPLYPSASRTYQGNSPSASFIEPTSSGSSPTPSYRRSSSSNRGARPPYSVQPGSSYHPGMHPSIPASTSSVILISSDRDDSASSGGSSNRRRLKRG